MALEEQGINQRKGVEWREHQKALYAKRTTDVGSDQQKLFQFSGDELIYFGRGAKGLATSQTGWLIQKFTWSSGKPTSIQSAYGIWDDRASLSYE